MRRGARLQAIWLLAVLAGLGLPSGVDAAAKATLKVSSPFVAPGGKVVATGTGFRKGETVALTLDSTAIGTAKATAAGKITARLTIPAQTPPGTHTLHAAGRTSHITADRAFAVETSWAQYRFGAARWGLDTSENVLDPANVSGLVLAWSKAGNAFNDGSSPSDASANVYQICNFALCAYSQSTGKRIWRSAMTSGEAGAPAIGGGMVIVAESYCFSAGANCQRIRGLNQKTGAAVWTKLIAASGDRYPLLVGGTVYYDTSQAMVAISAATGATQWSASSTDGYATAPAYAANELVAGSVQDALIAVSTTTHKRLWRVDPTFPITLSPIIAAGEVYAGGVAPGVAGFGEWNAKTGAPGWSDTNVDPTTTAAYASGIVYVGTDAGLVAYDATNGNVLWTADPAAEITGAPVVANGIVYYGAGTKMAAIDATSGAPLWSVTGTANVTASPMVANGRLYWADTDGNLAAYHL